MKISFLGELTMSLSNYNKIGLFFDYLKSYAFETLTPGQLDSNEFLKASLDFHNER